MIIAQIDVLMLLLLTCPVYYTSQVIATIHQPNSAICDCFDDWMLLSRGRMIYSGPWASAVDHFQGLGHSCPMYKNPADYFMTLASAAEVAEQLADAFAAQVSGVVL